MEDSNGQLREVVESKPCKVLAIRFKKILSTTELYDDTGQPYERYEFEKARDRNGNPTLIDSEYYSFSGSKILIEQAMNDFSRDDLPCPTVIKQFVGKNGQTFFKFT